MNRHTDDGEWVPVCDIADIPPRGARRVSLGSTFVAVFRTADDRVFALEDRCPHKDGPLSQGIVHANAVTCPLHNWVIDLETGSATGADTGCTRRFDVALTGSIVSLKHRRAVA